MKNLILAAFFVSTALLVACSGNDSPSSDPSIAPLTTGTPQTTALGSDTLKATPGLNIPVEVSSASTNPVTINTTQGQAQPTPTATVGTGKGLNPAHGQPGHRCDISVGMPLNSPVGKTTTTTAPAVQTITAPNTTQGAAPVNIGSPAGTAKLNPAHGQPGHDCAVQVGAPLKN